MNEQSVCRFQWDQVPFIAFLQVIQHKEMSSWQLNKWSNTSLESLAQSVYLKLCDQRMSYPMAWLRSSPVIPQLPSFYRCSQSPLSSCGVTSSLMSLDDAATGNFRFWTREIRFLSRSRHQLIQSCRPAVNHSTNPLIDHLP